MELPTERTPLLDSAHRLDGQSRLPCISRIEKSASSPEDGSVPYSPQSVARCIQGCSTDLPSEADGLALLILVCIRLLSVSDSAVQSQRRETEAFVLEKWLELKAMDAETVHASLWLPFPLQEESEITQNVMQTILAPTTSCPTSISLDSLVTTSLLKVWRQGRPDAARVLPPGTASSTLARLHRVVAPRVMHLAELVLHAMYLVIFAIYVMEPQHLYGERPRLPYDYRPMSMLVYSGSRIIKEPRKVPVSFYITFLVLLASFPLKPEAPDFPYITTLLLAFGLHIIQLLVPLPPSPVLVMPSHLQFPLSDMLQHLFDSILLPVFAFFLPVFILTLFLLANSLSFPFTLNAILPAPAATRDAMLTLFFVLFILFLGLITQMILQTSSVHVKSGFGAANPTTWDAYGPTVGFSVRQSFFISASSYSQPFFFPAPLNLLRFFLISIPQHIMCLLGWKVRALQLRKVLETTLWCMFVLPFTVPFGVFWLWGLL